MVTAKSVKKGPVIKKIGMRQNKTDGIYKRIICLLMNLKSFFNNFNILTFLKWYFKV